MRLTVLGLVLIALPCALTAQPAPPDSAWLRTRDTVRVWSKRLDVGGARGVVTRAGRDTLGFVAPAGFRKIPREYVASVASIQRIDVLEGPRRRSALRAIGGAGLGAVFGGFAGGLLGVGAGTLLYEMNKEKYADSDWDNRAMAQIICGGIGLSVGGVAGLVAGGIDGLRAREQWRRVK